MRTIVIKIFIIDSYNQNSVNRINANKVCTHLKRKRVSVTEKYYVRITQHSHVGYSDNGCSDKEGSTVNILIIQRSHFVLCLFILLSVAAR